MLGAGSGIGPGRVRQFVGVAVQLEDVPERVFAINHPVGFLSRVIFAHLAHPLAPALPSAKRVSKGIANRP